MLHLKGSTVDKREKGNKDAQKSNLQLASQVTTSSMLTQSVCFMEDLWTSCKFGASRCENIGQTLLCHCLGHFKILRGDRSCTKWKNVFVFCFFGRILPASSCLSALMISQRVLIHPPPPFHFSAWNRHSYGNGFLYNPVNCRNAQLILR